MIREPPDGSPFISHLEERKDPVPTPLPILLISHLLGSCIYHVQLGMTNIFGYARVLDNVKTKILDLRRAQRTLR